MSAIAHPGNELPPEPPPDWVLPVVEDGKVPPVEAVEIEEAWDERDAADADDTDAKEAVEAREPVESVASTEFGNAVSVKVASRHGRKERSERQMVDLEREDGVTTTSNKRAKQKTNYSRIPVNVGSLVSPLCTTAVEGMTTK